MDAADAADGDNGDLGQLVIRWYSKLEAIRGQVQANERPIIDEYENSLATSLCRRQHGAMGGSPVPQGEPDAGRRETVGPGTFVQERTGHLFDTCPSLCELVEQFAVPQRWGNHNMSNTRSSRSDVRPRLNNEARREPILLLAFAVAATFLTGCSATAVGDTNLPGKPLQLRLVISSVDGLCTAQSLTADGAATACDQAETITYELSDVLGVITPESVTPSDNQGSTHSVNLDLNDTDIDTLSDASQEALDQNLAIVLDGRVLSAPLVKDTLSSSPLTLMFETASEAEQVAADLMAATTP